MIVSELKRYLKSKPFLHQAIIKLLHLPNYIKEKIFGTKALEAEWQKGYEKYGEDISLDPWFLKNDPHRKLLINTISKYSPADSILEIGCAAGVNLYLLAGIFPKAKLKGIDLNHEFIQKGNEALKKENISNVELMVMKADELDKFKDKSYDIVFASGVLLYIGPDKIKKVMENMFRITKSLIIVEEFHASSQDERGSFDGAHYIRDYIKLMEQFTAKGNIVATKISNFVPVPDKNWEEYGYIIEAKI
jgi:ubiquinone/menaquinone biosynthesis C-methylase UbiE